jgi:hypothetical protein
MRREGEAFGRLKRDRRCAIVVLCAIAAMLCAVVIWLMLLSDDTVIVTRGRPIYWALMAPFAYWAVQLAAYERWAVRWLRTAQVLAPVIGGLGVGAAAWTGSSASLTCAALFAVSLLMTFGGAFAYRGSMLDDASIIRKKP